MGVLDDIGGAQAPAQGRRQLQAINGEGFFQAFPQSFSGAVCINYSLEDLSKPLFAKFIL
jgi:hypothetical protein